jgi:hypothetical protein
MNRQKRIQQLLEAISSLTEQRISLIEQVVQVFQHPKNFNLNSTSLLTSQIVEDFGDILRMHHYFSREPFSKDKFEYALEKVLAGSSIDAKLAPRGQRGFDIRIGTEKFSLKTEAAKAIRKDSIHISKFMELGGGDWGDNPDDLNGLRDQYISLLGNIERILTLRALRKGNPVFEYELVEIPKALLLKAATGRLEMMTYSKQFPKPGYCYVEDSGHLLYSLYFDGGGERKLQVKGLKKSLCCIHANWAFDLPEVSR